MTEDFFKKDYKAMPSEQRKADPDWKELTPLERMAALGLLRNMDGTELTLEEQYQRRIK